MLKCSGYFHESCRTTGVSSVVGKTVRLETGLWCWQASAERIVKEILQPLVECNRETAPIVRFVQGIDGRSLHSGRPSVSTAAGPQFAFQQPALHVRQPGQP